MESKECCVESISVGETGPSWTWFLSKLKECIGEIPDLTIISDRHAAILSGKLNLVDEFRMAINELQAKKPDVYQRLIEAGVERWSRAYFTHDRYNYMTSNSADSINNLTRDVRKAPITNLIEWYRQLVEKWYCERQERYKDGPLDELSPWATEKMRKRMQKSINWVVVGIETGKVYEYMNKRG
ncbi:hypothetical protein Tco_0817734 [Tanacetum coccineum]